MGSHLNAGKILGLFLVICLGFIIFLARVFDVALSDKYAGEPVKRDIDTALRGEIVTSDGFHVASSRKTYIVSVIPHAIDPAKKDIFIKFFSIYSGLTPEQISKALLTEDQKVMLLKEVSGREAKYYKQLSASLDKMKVFVPYKVGAKVFRRGLEIEENQFLRSYPYGDSLQPILGFVKPDGTHGLSGIEKFEDEVLNDTENGKVTGARDVSGNIIFTKSTVGAVRDDGDDVNLSINFKLQKQIEQIVDEAELKHQADNILAAVMEPQTGKLLALASSKRYVPYNINANEVSNMKADAVQYIYEPGSTIKPILFAIALDSGKLNQFEPINCFGGKYQVDKKTITDEHKMGVVPAEDVIAFSSNIGIVQITSKLTAQDMYYGLKKFGFTQKTHAGIAYELGGDLPTMAQLNSQIYKAVISYGYSMRANFLQLMAAYNIFTNNGVLIEPTLFDKPRDANASTQVISQATAAKMRNVLLKTVQKGTGVGAQVQFFEVGGKTGTAHIAKNGQYVGAFNSSFFGYVSDGKKSYTIGVLVIEPKIGHFGAETAVPVFRKIALSLGEDQFLAMPADANLSLPPRKKSAH